MIYLGNGMYSDSSLSHGGPWKNHKYIRIENGRYIYPGDIGGNKGKINWGAGSGSNPNNSKANNAFRRDTIKAARKTADVDYEMAVAAQQQKFWESQKPESISSQVDFVATKKALDDALDNQDKNGTQVSTKTYSRNAPPPGIDYKTGRDRHNNRKQEKRLQYTDKYQSGVNNQGPSAAERAQSYAYNPYYKDPIYRPGTMGVSRKSKNVDQGESRESEFIKDWRLKGVGAVTDRVKQKGQDLGDAVKGKAKELKDKRTYKDLYGTVKVTKTSSAQRAQSNSSGKDVSRNVSGMPRYGRPDNKNYQNSVSSQGPSAAERAQRYYGSNASKNTSSGSNSVKYKKTKDINKNKKYQKSVSSQGPSAAERAQTTRYYSSKINGKWDTPPEAESNNIHGTTRQRMVTYNNKSKGPSAAEMAQRNANGGSRNVEKKPKKKKSVKSAVKSWVKKNIIGAPGKVTTHN